LKLDEKAEWGKPIVAAIKKSFLCTQQWASRVGLMLKNDFSLVGTQFYTKFIDVKGLILINFTLLCIKISYSLKGIKFLTL
jgi:hypothetical protein